MGTHRLAGTLLLAALVSGPAGVLLGASAAGASTRAPAHQAGAACTPGQIILSPTISEQPYNHISVSATSWTFGWTRSDGCGSVAYRMLEDLVQTVAPAGNPRARRTARYVVDPSSPASGSSTMALLRAASIGGRFYGCEQLDVAVKTNGVWHHRWGGFVNAPGATRLCQPPPVAQPGATVAVSCRGTGSYDLVNTASTTAVVFNITINGTTSSKSIGAGQNAQVPFADARPGSSIAITAGGRMLASATVPASCPQPPVTKPGGSSPPGPVTSPGGSTPPGPKIVTDYVATPATGGAVATPVWVFATMALLAVLVGPLAWRRSRRRATASTAHGTR